MMAIVDGNHEEINKHVVELRESRSTVSLSNIHVEDGPIFPWFYAAQELEKSNRTDDIRTIITLIDAELNHRFFQLQPELEKLRDLTL